MQGFIHFKLLSNSSNWFFGLYQTLFNFYWHSQQQSLLVTPPSYNKHILTKLIFRITTSCSWLYDDSFWFDIYECQIKVLFFLLSLLSCGLSLVLLLSQLCQELVWAFGGCQKFALALVCYLWWLYFSWTRHLISWTSLYNPWDITCSPWFNWVGTRTPMKSSVLQRIKNWEDL